MNEKRQATMADDLTRDFAYQEPDRHSPAWQILRDISETIILTLLMFLVIRLVVQDFQVDGTSMVPTLQNSQFVLVDKLTYVFGSPDRGDIVVFNPPTSSKDPYIKRIIGLPGDHVVVNNDGYVSVNGVQLDEHYVSMISDVNYAPTDRIVPPGQYFVMGDNRPGSLDSRYFGPITRASIIGRATLVYWPLQNFHILPDEHPAFAHVPAALSTPSTPGKPDIEVVFLMPGLAAALRWRLGGRSVHL